MLPSAATEFYQTQRRINVATQRELERLWRRMGDDLDASWRRLKPPALAALLEGQRQATAAAEQYVPRVLAQTGVPDQPEGDLRPESLVGVASDGRPITSLVDGAVVKTKTAIADGATIEAALAQGTDWLTLMAALQVADAARQAVGIMTTSRKNLGGTVRVLTPPSCQRCAILAGRFYRWSKGFDRHPRCDCMNLPAQNSAWARSAGLIDDPMDAYRRGEIKDLTQAQRFAIDNGASISSVVNATRGMSTTATRRAISTVKPAPGPAPGMPDLLAFTRDLPRAEEVGRLTPEGSYRQANGDRDEAIRLLREWGYLA